MIEHTFIKNSKNAIREAGMVMKEARLYVYTNARRATNTTKTNRYPIQ